MPTHSSTTDMASTCPLCGRKVKAWILGSTFGSVVRCPNCGKVVPLADVRTEDVNTQNA